MVFIIKISVILIDWLKLLVYYYSIKPKKHSKTNWFNTNLILAPMFLCMLDMSWISTGKYEYIQIHAWSAVVAYFLLYVMLVAAMIKILYWIYFNVEIVDISDDT